MIEVPVTETQLEYYEHQIDELENEISMYQQLYAHQLKRAKHWKKRFEYLLEAVTEARLA